MNYIENNVISNIFYRNKDFIMMEIMERIIITTKAVKHISSTAMRTQLSTILHIPKKLKRKKNQMAKRQTRLIKSLRI